MKLACALYEFLVNKKILFPATLLLLLVLVNSLFFRAIFSELDILEHFLFGFVLSEIASQTATMRSLENRFGGCTNKEIMSHANLIIRIVGFVIVGGLLWESFEYFLLPTLGITYNPFFKFPITLHNIDGTLDVIVGFLGCLTAWYMDRS